MESCLTLYDPCTITLNLGLNACALYPTYFHFYVGVLQGEIISPFLFALFINDIELNLQENLNDGISIDQLQLYLLLFADDAVLFSETRQGLQNHLINLENYCTKCNLSVNVPKTKIVVFRKGGNLGQNDKWFYAGEEVEVVNSFANLGVVS